MVRATEQTGLLEKARSKIMPAAASFHKELPDVKLSSSYEGNKWRTELTIGGVLIVKRIAREKPDILDLQTFAKSLKWKLGDMIEIAEGVYVAP